MDPQVSRSDFLQSLGRGSLVAGLAGLGAAALHGKKSVSECFNENYCASCWAYVGCGLPEKKELTRE
jgi:hypothetical protein